ncbi:hypothetical protein DRN69_05835 [Candidatus Pacearchaeota archaeon]|nr:MAG: hypothetical protein DRN69_05835 [Candidatus Pacearchaeota archaeon]
MTQSTQNLDKAVRIYKIIKKYIKNLKFFNTICKTTMIKQNELNHLAKRNNLVIIVGSKNSANTKDSMR